MTAPTQPPDPRVQRIVSAIGRWWVTPATTKTHEDLARVLVEELGGREEVKFATADDDMRIDGWNKVCQVLWLAYPNMNAAMQAAPVHDRPALAIRQFAAQQRENAETIRALRERVAEFDRANTELDNARKSAEQSARDLRAGRATLRAELDAIKGAQEPWATVTPSNDGWSFKQYKYTKPTDAPFNLYRHPAPPHNPFAAFIDALKADRDMQWYYHCNVAMAACDKGVPHDQANAAAFLFMERLLGEYTPLHAIPEYTPAPALPVVGACVKTGHYTLTWLADKSQNQQECERFALNEVAEYGGVACRLYRDVTPLTTEGGK